MKGNSFKFIVILLINILLSYLFNRTSNFFNIIVIETLIWLVLFILYYFLSGKKKECIINYSFYYLVNLFLINILFIIFNLDFIMIKVINLFVIGLFSFIKLDLIKVKSVNIYLFLFNVVVFFLLSSCMVPIGVRNSTIDYSVFRYIGLLISKGKVPYRDVFDHKGLLLYLINYLGIIIDKEIGIWIVELVLLYLSIIIIYKIVKLFIKKNSLFTTIVIFLGLIFPYSGAGNSVEQYGMFFILIGMYLFYKDLNKYKGITLKNGFLIGLSLGAVLMLRPNMIACYICMAIYLLIVYIRSKRIKELFRLIGIFLMGIVTFILPCIIYLGINGALDEFIYQYLVFNFSYSSNGNSNLVSVIKFFLINCKLIFISIFIIIFFIVKRTYDRSYLLLSLAMISLSFILVISPKNEYAHYAIVMIPTFIYPTAIFIEYIYEILNDYLLNKVVSKFIIILFVIFIFMSDFIVLYININRILIGENEFELIEDIIGRETNEDDNILVFGNRVNIYLNTNRFTYSKYPYQIPVISIDDKLKNDFKNEIKNSLPKLIIVYDDVVDDKVFKGNDVSKELFLDCFGEVIDKYEYYYDSDNYYIYKLK